MEGNKKGKRAVDAAENLVSIWGLIEHKGITATFMCISLFALLVRVSVSFHPYSGAGNPPKFGDYEAQRHWMEVTLNLSPKEWYTNSTSNDLSYWGLDYPPFTAYQSFLHGLFIKSFHQDSVALLTSRGHESYIGKLLMRWTVLLSDMIIFFPSVLYFVIVYHQGNGSSYSTSDFSWHIVMMLVNPCLILIDHRHFQYNCISLGFAIGAVAAIFCKRELLACILFCLSLNHKQMSAYFAPAFFGHLLGKCLRRKNPLLEVAKLGLVVIGTFTLLWWPYLHSHDAFLRVLSRLAPFERGIYEDYVANYWCTSSVIFKWKRLFTMQSLKLLSFGATISAFLPSTIQQICYPSNRGFLYALLNSSFAFYFFSFQVHEKSILLPLLPASLLALEEPLLYRWLTQFALLSMFPLLCRDNLILPYISLFGLTILLFNAPFQGHSRSKTYDLFTLPSFLSNFLICCSFVLHIVYLTVQPPEKYPFLLEAIIMLFCFSQFVLLAIYTNIKQWRLHKQTTLLDRGKKLI